jgi:ech hydrogenase subunit F
VPSRLVRYDPLKCIYCANCVDVCLQGAVSHDLQYTSPRIHKKQEATVVKHRGLSTNSK